MSTRRTWLALPFVLFLVACGSGEAELETRTFRLETLDAGRAARIVEPYVWTDREGNPGLMTVARGALTVRETPDNLERIARVLEEFDQPEEELRLRFHVIEADGFEGSDPAIADVEEQLRELFRFEGYRLVGEGVLGVADGGSFRQSLTGGAVGWTVTGEAFRTETGVSLGEVGLWTPTTPDDRSSPQLFETSVNVRTGQTLVLGSARSPDGQGAVILVVRAEPVR